MSTSAISSWWLVPAVTILYGNRLIWIKRILKWPRTLFSLSKGFFFDRKTPERVSNVINRNFMSMELRCCPKWVQNYPVLFQVAIEQVRTGYMRKGKMFKEKMDDKNGHMFCTGWLHCRARRWSQNRKPSTASTTWNVCECVIIDVESSWNICGM